MSECITHITRHGIRIRKHSLRVNRIRIAGSDGAGRFYEYFATPVNSQYSIPCKLGQLHRTNAGRLHALRGMKAGTQLNDEFGTVREAEEWIAQCDTWGSLETADEP